MKGTKLEEQTQNFNKNMRDFETKRFFCFAEQLETPYFVFRETIETRRNSDLFRTVSYFAKLKKYETVKPIRNTGLITKENTLFSMLKLLSYLILCSFIKHASLSTFKDK